MAKNKVVFGNTVLIDLTADTVTADKLLYNYTAHDAAGAIITGTCTYDVDSGDATVQVGEILADETAYARGAKLTGTMPNRGAVTLTIDDISDELAIPQGYHDGSGKAILDPTEVAKIVAGNIKQGITILGVTGTLEPSSAITVQSKTFTPTVAGATIVPDAGYDYLTQVTVAAIPYVETPNAAGGTTVTIAG